MKRKVGISGIPAELGAHAKGMFVSMEEIPEEVFFSGVLGTCCGIEPSEGRVYAPINGRIIQLADTLHAIGIQAGSIELLIHVGVDTVDMKGEGFTSAVKMGQTVKKGDLLLTIDLDKIREAGHASTVIMAVTNSNAFSGIEMLASGGQQPGDPVLRIHQ